MPDQSVPSLLLLLLFQLGELRIAGSGKCAEWVERVDGRTLVSCVYYSVSSGLGRWLRFVSSGVFVFVLLLDWLFDNFVRRDAWVFLLDKHFLFLD